MAICVLCFILAVLLVGLWYVILTFVDRTRVLFDLDQAWRFVPKLLLSILNTLIVFLDVFVEDVDFEEKNTTNNNKCHNHIQYGIPKLVPFLI